MWRAWSLLPEAWRRSAKVAQWCLQTGAEGDRTWAHMMWSGSLVYENVPVIIYVSSQRSWLWTFVSWQLLMCSRMLRKSLKHKLRNKWRLVDTGGYSSCYCSGFASSHFGWCCMHVLMVLMPIHDLNQCFCSFMCVFTQGNLFSGVCR